MSKVMTPAEIASEFKSDGKTVRKFLRSITPKDEQPGKGSRWAVPANATQLKKLQKQFNEWTKVQLEERAKRAAAAAAEAAGEVEDETADTE